MIRHFFLFAAAPGRQGEAEESLSAWLSAAADRPEMRGGAVLRARAGEFGDFDPPLAVTYDVESKEGGLALREAMSEIPNPMAADIPGAEPPDQGAILFAGGQGHDHGQQHEGRHQHEGDHHHAEPGHAHLGVSADAAAKIEFDRGGGMLGRLMHAHFEVIAEAPAASDSPGARI